MKRLLLPLMVFILAGLISASCSEAAQPPPTVGQKPPATGVATPAPKAGWEKNWETTLAEAKSESRVTVYTIWPAEIRIAVSQAFMAKFGIEVEFATFGRSTELIPKVQAEQRTGLYLADVFANGATTAAPMMKEAGLLGPMEPLLILPEVTDPNAWLGGKLPFRDKDRQIVAITAAPFRSVAYNTDLIQKGEITSYRDVLKPQYKGKITFNDPTLTGSGSTLIGLLALRVWNVEETIEFMTQLIKQQEAVVDRDQRLQVEAIARGKFAIGFGADAANITEFIKLGAPVDVAIPKEGTLIFSGYGGFSVPTKFAHPHAAKIFVNWLLTKEGQKIFAQAYGTPSRRTDVSTEGLVPLYIPQPGEKFFDEDEEVLRFRAKMAATSKEVLDKAMKK